MSGRESELESLPNPRLSPVVLRSPPNWTAVVFFGLLGGLHLSMAATSAWHQRTGYHMSVAFGATFVVVAGLFAVMRYEVAILPGRRTVIVRTGVGRVGLSRAVPFAAVQSVRVTLLNSGGRHESTVTVVCEDDELEIPASRSARQLALLLAMTLDVRLVKIYGDDVPPEPARRIAKLLESDQGNPN